MNYIFIERQKFTQFWLWVILTGLVFVPIYGIYKQLILGEQIGNNPLPDWGLIISSVIIFALIALFFVARLDTEINDDEIRIHFYPFINRRVNWDDVESANVVKYGFLGGWGIRFSTKYGTAYNIKGNRGLAIKLKNGKKILIGTQKEEELKKIVENIMNRNFE